MERRRNLSPDQFRREYFLTGKPVVLEGIASEWPAVKKWTFEYLLERCGQEDIDVLDGLNWKVQATPGADAVDAVERGMKVKDLLSAARSGSGWYGSFMELLDKYADMRDDIDWTLVRDYGSASMRLPWQRNILAKMYVGGPHDLNVVSLRARHEPVPAGLRPQALGARRTAGSRRSCTRRSPRA